VIAKCLPHPHAATVLVCFALTATAVGAEYLSAPPLRPLPTSSSRPLGSGISRFVDAGRGDDQNEGTETRPWKTLSHAVAKLSAGETLCLRGGTYYEHVLVNLRGSLNQPITIRSFPGELAVIDGGLREFSETPQSAWEPAAEGAAGEFRSVKVYPQLPVRLESTNLLGNFADSMVPLHGYRFLTDLRSDNHNFADLQGSKTAQGNGLYCGPGVFLDPQSHRLHVRLAPTNQPSIGQGNNYRGETDPRKLSLIIAAAGASPLELNRAAHVVLQDIVVRGARDATINLVDCSNITLDGVTSYGGSSALCVERTSGLRCVDSAFRGIAAPWLWRWSLKYRSIEARIVSASTWNPPAQGNRDFEFANCEFTDCVDGVFLGNVQSVSIHHCLLDNVSDDGFFLTCRTAYDGTTPGGDFDFHNNRISRVLSAFAFGVGHGRQKAIDAAGNRQLGKQTLVRHNVFDLRQPVLYQQPVAGPITTYGRLCGDHGSPAWEPIHFRQNTVYARESPWRNYYAAGLGKAMGGGTRRQIERNIFVHQRGLPGQVLPPQVVNLKASGNVHWCESLAEQGAAEFLKRFRSSPLYAETKWTKDDIYAPPDQAAADAGAGEDVPVGVHGRRMLYGQPNQQQSPRPALKPFQYPPRKLAQRRAAIVLGYPAFDAPLLQFALEKTGFAVDVFDRQWLAADDFGNYELVAILGSTVRAKMHPSGFAPEDHEKIRGYLDRGAALLVGRELTGQLFPGDSGRKFVESIVGHPPAAAATSIRVLQPKHPWIAHLHSSDWVNNTPLAPIRLAAGTNLVGDPEAGKTVLADIPLGRGRFIYVGWNLSHVLPHGRKPSTLAAEIAYEDQYQIYERIAAQLYAK
jgi:hypothetical protein